MKNLKVYLFLFIFLLFSLNLDTASGASNEKELFIVAQRAFEDGFYDVSLRYVTQLFEEFPKTERYVEAKLLEGQCYFFKKQYLKAFNVFKEVVDKDSYKDTTLFWLGETYLKGGDFPKAREQYRRLITDFPNSIYAPQAYYSLAWSFFEKGEYGEAEKIFQELLDKFPSINLADDAAFKAGECEYNAGQYEGAIFRFEKYLKDRPNSSKAFDANFNIAEAYYYLEQYSKAIEYYKKARELTKLPKNILNAMVGQGWGLIKSLKFEEGLKQFDEAQAFARVNGLAEDEALLGKASLYTAQDRNKDAIASYSELIQNFPGSVHVAESYLGRANTYYLLNDYPNAIADYKKIIEQYSSNEQFSQTVEKAQFGLAWTFLKSGSLEQSIASFKSVIDKTDNKTVKVSALTQIGDAYQEVGQFDKAIETYDRILKEMPDTPYTDYVQFRLGVVLLKSEKLDAALMALQALQTNFPKSRYFSDASYYIGVTDFKKKDWGAAIQTLEPLVKTMPVTGEFSSESRYVLGLSYFNLKQHDKAIAILSDILKLYPDRETVIQNARLGIAKAQYEQGAIKEALAVFKEIAFRYPKTDAAFEALIWLGQHAMSTGLYQLAIDNYSQALEQMSSVSKKDLVHFELGRAFHALGKLDKALEQYRQVSPQADIDLIAKSKLAIADIFSRELDPVKAVETYQNIIANTPDFARDAYMKIALIYRRANQHSDEIKAYEHALQSPQGAGEITNAQIQFAISDAYEIANQPAKAIAAYFKIPYLYEKEQSWVIKSYLRIAKLYENSEDWDKALAAYKKVIDLKVDESKFAEERSVWISNNRNKQ